MKRTTLTWRQAISEIKGCYIASRKEKPIDRWDETMNYLAFLENAHLIPNNSFFKLKSEIDTLYEEDIRLHSK